MALIEVYHVVASNILIDATNATDIPQGALVSLTAAGYVQLAASTDTNPIGIAGDTRSTGVTSFTPESGAPLSTNPKTSLTGSLILGAYGDGQRFTQNRVADNYNEVLASGKMTVYHSGGEFWTDQYDATNDFAPGDTLVVSAATNGNWSDTGAGATSGVCLNAPTEYPSGVPGTGTNATGFTALPEGGNSMSWGQFLHVKLTL